MHTSFRKALLASSLLLFPVALYAASTDFSGLGTLVDNFTKNVVTAVGYLFLATATVLFFYGVLKFMWSSREGKEKEVGEGKQFMLWGLIGLFVMFSVWGIIKFAQNTIGGDIGNTTITVPVINFSPGGSPGGGGIDGGNLRDNGADCSSPAQCKSGACGVSGKCIEAGAY